MKNNRIANQLTDDQEDAVRSFARRHSLSGSDHQQLAVKLGLTHEFVQDFCRKGGLKNEKSQ